jgi:hypothetical protein
MASYRIVNGRIVDSTTGLPQTPSNDVMLTPRATYETRLRMEEYQAFANEKAKAFETKFYKDQEERKSNFQSQAKLKQRYTNAKEQAKRQLEFGSDSVIMGRVQKYRENYYSNKQQEEVNYFNKETENIFEIGKKATQKEIDEAKGQFEYRVQTGTYTEISKYNEKGRKEILGYSYKTPDQISKQVQADIKLQQEQFKIDWENQGGVYSDYSGNLMSSMKSPGQIGSGYVKVGTPSESDQSVLSARAKDIANQVKLQEESWKNTGGSYINPYGNLISSNLNPTQINVNYPQTTTPQVDYFSKFNNGFNGFANVVTQGKPFVGGFVKVGSPTDIDLSLIQSRANPIINESKIGYTKSYFNSLANPQYAPLTPEQIKYNEELAAYNNQVLTPKQIVARQKPFGQWILDSASSGQRVQKETYDFLVNEPFLDKYVWGKVKSIPYGISAVAGTGEFIKSLGGETFRNYVLQLKASPGSVGAIPFGMKDSFPYQDFTREQIEATYQSSYTTGRLITGAAGYFTPAAPAWAAMDIAQARTPMEVIEPLILVGGTTALLKGGFKLAQYLPLKASALLGGSITKAGPILSFSNKLPQYLEYGSKLGTYAAPVALAAYSGYGLYQATPYLYSNDPLVSREAERRLFVSFGAGYVGGLGGDYLGTELFEKNLNWRIGKETVLQGGSSMGKLTAQEKVAVNELYSRAYGKELPGDVGIVTPIKDYTSANLDVFGQFSKKNQKALTRITDQTIKEFAGELYIGGSSQVPSQLSIKAYKKAGDIDIFLGNKKFVEVLTERINGAKLKGVSATATYSDDSAFQGAAHVNLNKNGIPLKNEAGEFYQFVNLHYDIGRTTQQLKLFGEPFQTTKGAFVKDPNGTYIFNIREQLRAKIEGYYFGSRAKDLVDIEGIMKGTEKAASLYKQYKTKNIWLDERAMFKPTKETSKATSDFVLFPANVGKELRSAYTPYSNYSIPEYAQIKVPNYGKDYYKPSKKDSYYSMGYSDYKPVGYAASYSPTYSAKYTAQYNSTYNPKYSPGYAPTYAPKYSPGYAPTYAPKYNTKYNPTYAPTYAPYYKPKYAPTYTPYYNPPKTPKNPPTFKSKQTTSDSKYYKQVRKAFSRGESLTYKPDNIENMILPIKTDWLKAIGYSKGGKKAKIQTINLLPSERKGSKQISRLLGFNFDKLF